MNVVGIFLMLGTIYSGAFAKDNSNWSDPSKLPVEKAILTKAPNVPPPITRKNSAKVIVEMEVKEYTARLADGVDYTFWGFGGSVPGPMIRIREGDYVEFHLSNHPSSKMPHNIDLHAVTGQGGGAEGSLTSPGKTSVFNFKALNSGLYIYHCATAPVGMHIANGMYGLILVEPKSGLPKVDKEFYVVQSDFYTLGKNGEKGLQPFDMEKAIKEQPDYIVFNGSVGALLGDNVMKADVGDNVRIFFGAGGPNISANFHVIGEIFDKVYQEGGSTFIKNVQTTVVPPGGSTIVEFKIDIPANYILVDHAIFRAFHKGALGILKVEGKKNSNIYSGKTYDGVYQPEGPTIQKMPNVTAAVAPKANTMEEQMKFGKEVYENNCSACHQNDGKGLKGAFPPLAKSDYLMNDKVRSIKIVLHGFQGPIVVNGETYDSVMPSLDLKNEDIANVLTYVRNSWGNKGDAVKEEEVSKVRKSDTK